MLRAAKVMAKLILEQRNPPSPAEIERLKGKYRLWKKLNRDGVNCEHCLFNHYDCASANKYYDVVMVDGFYCLAFLREGNYIK